MFGFLLDLRHHQPLPLRTYFFTSSFAKCLVDKSSATLLMRSRLRRGVHRRTPKKPLDPNLDSLDSTTIHRALDFRTFSLREKCLGDCEEGWEGQGRPRGRPTHGTCVWFKSSYYSCLIGINEFWDMNMYSESLRAHTISNSHNFSKLYYRAILNSRLCPKF